MSDKPRELQWPQPPGSPESPRSSGWFSRAGQPLDDDERAVIAAMQRKLGVEAVSGATPVEVLGWRELPRVLRDEDRDNRWWDAEEGERERLWSIAAERMTESELLEALGDASRENTDALNDAATIAITQAFSGGDPALARAASEAGRLTVHQHALARLADVDPDHYFIIKYRLFAGGRWPLGVAAGRFLIL